MKSVKKVFFYSLTGFLIIGIPLFAFAIINTMVSLKYETDDPFDCISLVTGTDLCVKILVLKMLLIVDLIAASLLVIFRKSILKR